MIGRGLPIGGLRDSFASKISVRPTRSYSAEIVSRAVLRLGDLELQKLAHEFAKHLTVRNVIHSLQLLWI